MNALCLRRYKFQTLCDILKEGKECKLLDQFGYLRNNVAQACPGHLHTHTFFVTLF